MRTSCGAVFSSPLRLEFKMVDRGFTRMTTRDRMPYIPHQSAQSIIHACFPCLRVHVSAYVVPSEDRSSNAPALQELPLRCLYLCTVCSDGRRQCSNSANVLRLHRTAKATILAFVMSATPLSTTLICLPHIEALSGPQLIRHTLSPNVCE